MKIMVTGGSGLVGSELKKYLPNAFYPSSSELDLLDLNNIKKYISKIKPNYIIHLAAHVGSLHDNIKNRCSYFDSNILMNTNLTMICAEQGVENFLGILSTCIYPDKISEFPITESLLHDGAPHESLMSYSYAKRAHSIQIDNYRETRNLNYQYLIPCNMYGLQNLVHNNRLHFLNDLVRKIFLAYQNNQDLVLFGDGTPLRQFMHASDFAKIISLYILKNISVSCNVAPDINLSINDYAKLALKVLGLKNIKIRYDDSLPNGQLRKDVSTKIFKTYFPDFKFKNLEIGIIELFNYYKANL